MMDRSTERLGRLNQLGPKCQTGIDRFMSVKEVCCHACGAALDRFLTIEEVLYLIGISRTQLMDRLIPRGCFPWPEGKLGPHPTSRVVFRLFKVLRWMEDEPRKYPWIPSVPANDNSAYEDGDAA